MAYITTQNRIASQIDALVSNVEGLSFVQHFDYPESISYVGNAAVVQSGQKLGKGCVFFTDADSHVIITNNTGLFNMHSLGNYELEAFVKFSEVDWDTIGYKFFGDHTFKYFDTSLTWAEAKAACEALGGHLATSTSAEKNAFLNNFLTIHLGCSYNSETGTWQWVTGEEWDYTNWADGEPSDPDNKPYGYINGGETWRSESNPYWNYVCEWDRDLRETNILTVGDLALTFSADNIFTLASNTFDVDCSTQVLADSFFNSWHHLLLRLSEGYIRLFVDASEVLKTYIPVQTTLAPTQIMLGGFVGYIDEFAFRRNSGEGSPAIPEYPYDTIIEGNSESGSTEGSTTINIVDAPVSRVSWSAENLPAGVTLSESGILSGHPVTTGTYNAIFSVSTNWGITSKTIKIIVR